MNGWSQEIYWINLKNNDFSILINGENFSPHYLFIYFHLKLFFKQYKDNIMVSGTTINADRIKTNYSLDLNGNIIAKEGWDVYEYDFTKSSGNTVFGVDFTITGTKGAEWQNDLTFKLENNPRSYRNFFVNFNNTSTNKPIPVQYYYGTIKYPKFDIISEKLPDYIF